MPAVFILPGIIAIMGLSYIYGPWQGSDSSRRCSSALKAAVLAS